MRHASLLAELLLAPAVAFPAVRRLLVSATGFPLLQAVAQLAALPAVPLPAEVSDAHVEWFLAEETHNLDEIDIFRTRHVAAGEAGLDNGRRECEALSVAWLSTRLTTSTTARPLVQERPGTPPSPR
jgi:hypothetical protein